MKLKRHIIWEVFEGGESFESFKKKILPKLKISSQVPKQVRKDLRVIRKLLQMSYYEYEFVDLVLTNCIVLLEKTMRVEYERITGTSAKKKSLFTLFEYFFAEGYFEISNKNALDQLRIIRNTKVHGTIYTLGGVAFLGKIEFVIHLINDLFENRALRDQRKQKTREINTVMKSQNEGLILKFGTTKYIIHQAVLYFINNKVSPNKYYFSFLPIFDLRKCKNSQFLPPVYRKCLVDVELVKKPTNMVMKGQQYTSEKTVEVWKMDEKNINRYQKWKEEVMRSKSCHSLFAVLDFNLDNDVMKVKSDFYFSS